MSNKMVHTNNAPKAIGPYSQAIKTGDLLYISGQIPVNPATGEVVESCFKAQTEQSMKNILAILNQEGLDFSNVVKTNIYITDMTKFGDVNEVYATFFNDYFPARACVQVSALPKNVLVEIEAIASYK